MPVAQSVRDLDIAILAGGLGTRLAQVLGRTPKILAPLAGKPFLEHLLAWLAGQGAEHVLLCLGHGAEAVQDYLSGSTRNKLRVSTIVEAHPLGTAGAIAHAAHLLHSDPVLVMNGDTLVDVDLAGFLQRHRLSGAPASVVCASVEGASRYGSVEIDTSGRILRFVEKECGIQGPAWISAGVYLLGRDLLDHVAHMKRGSLEQGVFETLPPGTLHAFQSPGLFLDIGTPESLAQAPALFAQHPSFGQMRASP